MNRKIFLCIIIEMVLAFNLSGIDFIAQTLKVKGVVNLTRNQQISPALVGDRLFNGDELETKNESYAAVKFADQSSLVKLFPNSILNINTTQEKGKTDKKSVLKIGELWAKVEKGTSKFEIETSTTVASVKGTNFLMNVTEEGLTNLYSFEGEVHFQNKLDGETALIRAGQRGTSTGQGPILITAIDPNEIGESTSTFINEELEPIEIEAPEQIEEEEIPPIEQPEPEIEMPKEEPHGDAGPFNMGGGVGTVMLGDNTYTQIRLMPELVFGKFGLGLDVDLMIDSNGNVRKEDWDDFEDYVNKIYYLRYGQCGDSFYGRLGGFKSYTLGHGLVMKDYSNMLRYPEYKQIGIQLGGKLPVAGMTAEIFTANAVKNEILGGRLTIKPLNNTEIPLFKNLIFGGTVAHDRNQVNGLLDSDDDNYPDYFDDYPYDENWHNEIDYNIEDELAEYISIWGDSTGFHDWFYYDDYTNGKRNPSFTDFEEDAVTVFGVDYELPLVTNKLFYLSHYGEAAQIIDHKMGFIFPGFYSKFLIFHMNLEFRIYQDDFIPAFFDQLYDEQRAVVYTDIDSVITKETLLKDMTKSQGWYGSITANLLNFIYLTVAYEDMYGEDDVNFRSLWGKASFDTKFIPKLTKAEIGYTQTGFDKLNEFKTPNAVINGSLGYALGGSTQLVGSYQERYVDLNNDGKIKGKDETITSMSMGVEFSF
ncbi:MAG: FecR domain-containing protein [Candidatus Cloacimonetes bacterium]|nr:FecR domain-containing protein [Candidatus Cloacimonadota bacterium]